MKKDRDPRVRNAAILKLAEVGDENIMQDLQSHHGLTERRYDKIDALRMVAARSITDSDASSIIALALNDKKGMVQLEAIRTMGALKDTSSLVHLEEKLHDTRQPDTSRGQSGRWACWRATRPLTCSSAP